MLCRKLKRISCNGFYKFRIFGENNKINNSQSKYNIMKLNLKILHFHNNKKKKGM